jgi:hypothetical protein
MNYWRNRHDEHTAKSRFIHWYTSAVENYKRENSVQAYRELGKALHYLQDLNSPPHTGDSPNDALEASKLALGQHAPYEREANRQRENSRVENGGLYDLHGSNSLDIIANEAAQHSFSYYDYIRYYDGIQPPIVYRRSMYDAIPIVLGRSQIDSAGLIYRFFLEVAGYRVWCCTGGIDYREYSDFIVHGSNPGFELNLTRETITIPEGFTPVALSRDGGIKWSKVNRNTFDHKRVVSMLNRGLTLHVSSEAPVRETKRPPENSIVTFPTIAARPKAPKYFINYKIAEDTTGATKGGWVVTEKKGSEVVIKNEEQRAQLEIAGVFGSRIDAAGYGRFCQNHGVAIMALPSNNKPVRTRYFIRYEPNQDGEVITAASRPRRIRSLGEQRAPRLKPRNGQANIAANTRVFIPGVSLITYTTRTNKVNIPPGARIRFVATESRPASALQIIE